MSDGDSEVWTLYRQDRRLADLVVTDRDFPWLSARVEPRDGFDDVRPLFAEELRALHAVDDDPDAAETAYDAIRSTVTLRYPDGTEVPEFLLHIEGDEAWWRWSDEKFGDSQ